MTSAIEVSINEGQKARITHANENNNLYNYRAIVIETKDVITFPEAKIFSGLELSKPLDLLFAGKIDTLNHFALRHKTLKKIHEVHRVSIYRICIV